MSVVSVGPSAVCRSRTTSSAWTAAARSSGGATISASAPRPRIQVSSSRCEPNPVVNVPLPSAFDSKLPELSEHLLHPPRDRRGEGDGRGLGGVGELPGRPVPVGREVEVPRRGEVVLGTRLEGDAPFDPREPEDPRRLTLVREPDDVPVPGGVQQAVRVDLALGTLVAPDGVVREPDRLAPADGRLDLREVGSDLRGVPGSEQVHGHGPRGVIVERARAAEGQVLQRKAQRLGVGELPLEEVEAGLERGQLRLVEVDRREVVALRREGVEIALERVVARALDGEREAHRLELAAVGVEPAQERLLAHAAISLHVLVDLVGRDRPMLGHEEGDERELTNQLVVVSHRHGRVGAKGVTARR